MAALLNYDSDCEFGYDFTSEDEALLIQLASTEPNPAAAGPRLEVTSVIDAVPARTGSDCGHDVATFRNARSGAPRNCDGSRVLLGGPSDGAESVLETQPRILPTPVSLDEDVTYPDCMSPADPSRCQRLTDPQAPSESSTSQRGSSGRGSFACWPGEQHD